MMFSAICDNVEVKDIGLKSLLKSVMFLASGTGGTSAIFHTFGTLHSRKDALNISVIAGSRMSEKLFRTQLGSSSGPLALETLIARSSRSTVVSETLIGSSLSVDRLKSSGSGGKSFITLIKASLILFPKPSSLSSTSNLIMDLRSGRVDC